MLSHTPAWRTGLRCLPLLLTLTLMPIDGRAESANAPQPPGSPQREAPPSVDALFGGWDIMWLGQRRSDVDPATESIYALRKSGDRWQVETITARDRLEAVLRDVNYEVLWLNPEKKTIIILASYGRQVGQTSKLSLCEFGLMADNKAKDRLRSGYTHCNTEFSKCDGRASDALTAPLAILTATRICYVVPDKEAVAAAMRTSSLAELFSQDQAAHAARREQARSEREEVARQEAAKRAKAAEERRSAEYHGSGQLASGTRVASRITIYARPSQQMEGTSIDVSARFTNEARVPQQIDQLPLAFVRTKDGRVFAVVFTTVGDRPRNDWLGCVPVQGQVILNPGQTCTFAANGIIPGKLEPKEFYSTGSAAVASASLAGVEIPVATNQ